MGEHAPPDLAGAQMNEAKQPMAKRRDHERSDRPSLTSKARPKDIGDMPMCLKRERIEIVKEHCCRSAMARPRSNPALRQIEAMLLDGP